MDRRRYFRQFVDIDAGIGCPSSRCLHNGIDSSVIGTLECRCRDSGRVSLQCRRRSRGPAIKKTKAILHLMNIGWCDEHLLSINERFYLPSVRRCTHEDWHNGIRICIRMHTNRRCYQCDIRDPFVRVCSHRTRLSSSYWLCRENCRNEKM